MAPTHAPGESRPITHGAPLPLFFPTGLNSNPRIAGHDRQNPLERGARFESHAFSENAHPKPFTGRQRLEIMRES
jgi:hypothetical protein